MWRMRKCVTEGCFKREGDKGEERGGEREEEWGCKVECEVGSKVLCLELMLWRGRSRYVRGEGDKREESKSEESSGEEARENERVRMKQWRALSFNVLVLSWVCVNGIKATNKNGYRKKRPTTLSEQENDSDSLTIVWWDTRHEQAFTWKEKKSNHITWTEKRLWFSYDCLKRLKQRT